MRTDRPKVWPKLDQFLTNLAFLVITEKDFYEITQAAGVSFEWPKTVATGLVREYIEAGGLTDREAGMNKVRGALRMLESMVTTLTGLSSIEDIRREYQSLAQTQRVIDAANHALDDPENYERYFAALEQHVPNDVVSADHEVIRAHYAIHREEAKAGLTFVRIRGFSGIAELIGGFNPGRITVLMGATGFGKSNMGMNLCYAAAQSMGVCYVNMEMGLDDISKRAAVILSGKTWKDLDEGRIGVDELPTPRHAIHFTDGRELHVDAIIAWVRGQKRLDPTLGILYVDYDQKMILDVDHHTQEWRAMQLAFRRLEDCAKAAKIHVIIAAQMNTEGKISSSHRATFTAHSILTFRKQGDDAIVENSLKHRHARGPRAVPLIYTPHSAKISEAGNVFDLIQDDDGGDRQRAVRKKATSDKLNQFTPRAYKED